MFALLKSFFGNAALVYPILRKLITSPLKAVTCNESERSLKQYIVRISSLFRIMKFTHTKLKGKSD